MSETFHFKRKNPTFRSAKILAPKSKLAKHTSSTFRWFLHFRYPKTTSSFKFFGVQLFHVEPCLIVPAFRFSFSLFLPFPRLSTYPTNTYKLTLYFVFFSICCKHILPCNFPPNKHGRISIVGLRTDGRCTDRQRCRQK